MKRIVCSLVVLALAAPVLAAHDPCNYIEITLADGGSGDLKVYAKVAPDSSDTPVGISLTLVCSDGATTLEPCGVLEYDPCFPVFMDYAHEKVKILNKAYAELRQALEAEKRNAAEEG